MRFGAKFGIAAAIWPTGRNSLRTVSPTRASTSENLPPFLSNQPDSGTCRHGQKTCFERHHSDYIIGISRHTVQCFGRYPTDVRYSNSERRRLAAASAEVTSPGYLNKCLELRLCGNSPAQARVRSAPITTPCHSSVLAKSKPGDAAWSNYFRFAVISVVEWIADNDSSSIRSSTMGCCRFNIYCASMLNM